jgi:hypothetical protein
MLSPQPVIPSGGHRTMFTSPSGVFKSLFQSMGGGSTTNQAATSVLPSDHAISGGSCDGGLCSVPPPYAAGLLASVGAAPAAAGTPTLSQLDMDLYEQYHLQEGASNGLQNSGSQGTTELPYGESSAVHQLHHYHHQFHHGHSTSGSNNMKDETASEISLDDSVYAHSILIKEGYLYKKNDTGFRNWKKILFRLTDTRLSWKSQTDPSKRSYFLLKDTTIKRTKHCRFMLTQRVAGSELARVKQSATASASASAGAGAGGGSTLRAPSPAGTTDGASSSYASNNGGAALMGMQSSLSHQNSTGTFLYQKEIAAKTVEEMEAWIVAIQDAINDQNSSRFSITDSDAVLGAGGAHGMASSDDVSYVKGIEEFSSVEQWLQSTGIPDEFTEQYSRNFEAKGYGSTSLIAKSGLQDADLDYAKIENPAHRRVILSSLHSYFTPVLKVAVRAVSKFDNTFVFNVTSRWQYNRSTASLQLSQLRRFDKLMRAELGMGFGPHSSTANGGGNGGENEQNIYQIPALPSEAACFALRTRDHLADTNFYRNFRLAIELYLIHVVAAFANSEKLFLLLHFLELVPN